MFKSLTVCLSLTFYLPTLMAQECNFDNHTCPEVVDTPNEATDWQFEISPIEPYFWLANTDAKATLAGNDIPVDLSFFEEAVDNMGEGLHVRLELHLFAQKNKWSFVFDPTRLKADSSLSTENKFETRSTLKLTDFKVGYEVYEGVDFFGGVRYTSQDMRIYADEFSGRLKGSYHWWSPIVGVRYKHSFNETWHFSSGAYLGGFERGAHDDYTSSANVLFTYTFNHWLDFNLGYRLLKINMATGSGPTLFKYEATFDGFLIGANISLFD